ncbi:hypothetical protein OE88DRAFT_1641916 [Heliocybe sulcata]|uniref:Uncharacterized protein n=1 Tax=Heliocybe sulcata TaxID=5364 RepID=A0A5C3NFX1_9AGAM|nr:hypothetical protein OE88DRAFT_1641916 [Heliocybe sulcata]
MSFSVDDLVASLKSNHIGQEAMDLAALQAQLKQTLFCATSASTSQQRHDAEPYHCTTPTASTPGSSFSWSHMPHRRKGSVASIAMEEDIAEMEEDERMVEELLSPSSPATTSPVYQHNQRAPSSPMQAPAFAHRNGASAYTYASEPTSMFATQDPFYVAQMQAAQNASQNVHSFFAQAGRPAQHSPFVQAHERAHPVLMATAGGFARDPGRNVTSHEPTFTLSVVLLLFGPTEKRTPPSVPYTHLSDLAPSPPTSTDWNQMKDAVLRGDLSLRRGETPDKAPQRVSLTGRWGWRSASSPQSDQVYHVEFAYRQDVAGEVVMKSQTSSEELWELVYVDQQLQA